MIKLVATILVRALVEIALVLFVIAAVFVAVAYRTARRFVTTTPDALDRLSGPLAAGLALVSRARNAADGDNADDLAQEFDENDDRLPVSRRKIGHDEWRGMVV